MVMIVVSQAFWRLPARKERLLVHPCDLSAASQPHQRRTLGTLPSAQYEIRVRQTIAVKNENTCFVRRVEPFLLQKITHDK
jgi:hypothetical protein